MRKLLAAVLLLLSSAAGAATIYISDCGTGADGACVAGNDANPGTDPAAPWQTIVSVNDGNTYKFARGGAFARSTAIGLFDTGSTKENPIVLEDYTPTWCTGGCTSQKPIIYTTAAVNGFSFTDSGNADRDEGYTLRNLDIRGQGYDATPPGTGHAGTGIFVFNDADYITIDGVSVNGFSLGIYVSSANTTNPGANSNNERITIKNSTIQNNNAQGFLGGGAWMLIENNLFDYNGFAQASLDHNLYLDIKTKDPVSKGIIIRGNTLTNNAVVSGTCQGVSMVAHANIPDTIIENNTIIDLATSGACYGIDINADSGGTSTQDHSRLVIRGNKLVLSGGASQGIGCSACPNALIENNIIIRLGGTGTFLGINVPSSSTYRDDPTDGVAVIRNNSIYIDASDAAAAGIKVGSSTTGEVVASNVIVFSASSSASANCFELGSRAVGTFTAFDYNVCYRPSADAVWSSAHSTLAAAQGAGYDTNSSKADPGMTTPASSDYLFEASSGASILINAASTTYKARLGYRGKPANGARDIGACEYRTADACSAATASVPSSATGLR